MTKGISRRNFLTGAALASVAAGAGLAGCAPSADKKTTEAVGAADSTAQYEWEKAPEPISDIAETVDTDILVIGAGLSGCACACSAAENGGKVTVVEKTESWQGPAAASAQSIRAIWTSSASRLTRSTPSNIGFLSAQAARTKTLS